MGKSISQEGISDLFNAISSKYDSINRIISLGIDKRWRKVVKRHLPEGDLHLLDCATGTGDQLLSIMQSGKIERGFGIDLAEEMLEIGKQKVALSPFSERVELILGNVLQLPFEKDAFDCVTMTFGIRNVQGDCLPEMLRVLKARGKVMIVEFSLPKNPIVRTLHLFYLRKVLPRIGGWMSGNPNAYRYLNETIESFPYGDAFLKRMERAGFSDLRAFPLSFGIATLYTGVKP